MRFVLLLLLACHPGPWRSVRAEKPATRTELAAWPVSVTDPMLRKAMMEAGFNAVERPPYKGELQLTVVDGIGTLRSDGFFVDEVTGGPDAIAEALAASQRVAEFVRNSGLPQQHPMPGRY